MFTRSIVIKGFLNFDCLSKGKTVNAIKILKYHHV